MSDRTPHEVWLDTNTAELRKQLAAVTSERDKLVAERAGWMEEIDGLKFERDALAKERDELRKVVDRLPRTADGAPIWPGRTVYFRDGDGLVVTQIDWKNRKNHDDMDHDMLALSDTGKSCTKIASAHCSYSTRAAAAESARKRGEQ